MFGGRRLLPIVMCLCVLAVAAGSCGDDSDGVERASVPTAESTTTSEATTTTTEPAPLFEALLADPALTPEQQIEAAYLHSWDIYLDALENGRTDYLDLVYIDPSLSSRRAQIEGLVAEGHKIVGGIADHSIEVTILTPTAAVLVDEYVNHLTLTDAATGEPLEGDPNEGVAYIYDVVLEEGAWRIQYVERL